MANHESFSDLLKRYARRNFGERVTGGMLAKAGNEFFELDEIFGLKRQTVHNWLNGGASSPNDWWPVGALTRIICESPEEADTLLQAAGLKTIAQKSVERAHIAMIEDAVREKVESEVIGYWSQWQTESEMVTESVDKMEKGPQMLPSHAVLWGVSGVAVLALLGLAFILWPGSASVTAEPFLADDFSNGKRCATIWDFSLSRFASCDEQAGRLYFHLPLNTTSEWIEDTVDPTLTGESYITRLRFTAALTPADPLSLGALGMQTTCNGDDGWLVVYLGGAKQQIFAQYSSPQEPESPLIEFAPVTLRHEHTIEINWLGDGVHVALDGQVQKPVIPCFQPRLFNLNAGAVLGAQVDGYITDIQVWD